MTIDRVQCPSCGANIDAEGRDSLFCSYCGARLKVKTGVSGNPMAVLDGIKEDTSLIAKRTALAHVEEELTRLEAERQRVRRELEANVSGLGSTEKSRGVTPVIVIALLLGAAAIFGGSSAGDPSTVAFGVLLLIFSVAAVLTRGRGDAVRRRRKAALEAEAARALAEIRPRLGALRQKEETIRAEIERSINEM